MQSHFYEMSAPVQVHFHAIETHFRVKGFAGELVSKNRHKVARKWPIS